jgi:hypothetical protein
MENSAVTWKRISVGKADDVCDALLYIVRHGRVSRFLTYFNRRNSSDDEKTSHMEV